MGKLAAFWARRTPGQKKVLLWAGLGVGILSFLALGARTAKRGAVESHRVETKDLLPPVENLEETKYAQLERRLKEMEEESALRKAGRGAGAPERRRVEPEPPRQAASVSLRLPDPRELPVPASPPARSTRVRTPPLPPAPPAQAAGPLVPPPAEQVAETQVGGIHVAHNDAARAEPQEPAEKEKKTEPGERYFLPPCWMEATLLTGVNASTSGEGRQSPEPLFIRVQTPAVLPNGVKAKLKGCYIVAEARGNLAKERAEVRLTSLSCLGTGGESVIYEEVRGFVADRDSMANLGGRVVSKMGASAARAAIAGVFAGAGDAIQASAQTQAVSPLGVTQVVDTGDLARAAVGGGAAKGLNKLSELYLELARQATPVIEVGATKDVTVFITEGVVLRVRDPNDVEPLPARGRPSGGNGKV